MRCGTDSAGRQRTTETRAGYGSLHTTANPRERLKMSDKLQIALAEGDGIGPEITKACLTVFEAAGCSEHIEFVPVEMGSRVFDAGDPAGIGSDERGKARKNCTSIFHRPEEADEKEVCGKGYSCGTITIFSCGSYSCVVSAKHSIKQEGGMEFHRSLHTVVLQKSPTNSASSFDRCAHFAQLSKVGTKMTAKASAETASSGTPAHACATAPGTSAGTYLTR